MPDLEISKLPPISGAALQGSDQVPLTDVSASETKRISIQDLLSTGIVAAAPLPDGKYEGQLGFDTTNEIIYVWSGSEWLTPAVGSGGGATTLNELSDVSVPAPTSGDVLSYNGTNWVSSAAPPADISGSSINQLNDVNTIGADDGDILVWNEAAGEWQTTNRGTVPEKTSDLQNDGQNGTDPFITEADVNNILAGNNIDGTPNPGAAEYLQAGDNVSELNNDAGYITDAGVTKIVAGTNVTIDPVAGTGEVTINASGSAALALDDLTDVEVASPDAGDVLSYNGSDWVSAAAPPADISGSSINQLNDVNISDADDGDMLLWQTDSWVNTPAPTKTSDFTNDGNGDINNPFITEGGVSNILNGLNPDGTENPASEGYLKPGDNVSELNNDANYITNTDTAADANKLCGQDCSHYLDYQNFTNVPPTVDKIIAGTGIAIEPASGQGQVTVSSTISALEFAGNVDVTDKDTIPVVRNANQLYVNIGVGEFAPEWAEITNNASVASEANPGDFMLLDVNDTGDDPWTWIEAGTPPASDGLWVEENLALYPATLGNSVGIGTNDPQAKLHVNGNVIANEDIFIANSRSLFSSYVFSSTAGGDLQLGVRGNPANTIALTLKANKSAIFEGIVKAPYVSVNSTSPFNRNGLHVNGDISFNARGYSFRLYSSDDLDGSDYIYQQRQSTGEFTLKKSGAWGRNYYFSADNNFISISNDNPSGKPTPITGSTATVHVYNGLNTQFGTIAAPLGNVMPKDDWSSIPSLP